LGGVFGGLEKGLKRGEIWGGGVLLVLLGLELFLIFVVDFVEKNYCEI